MDHKKHQSGCSSSSSSFTENLFGPKDTSSASSSGLFSTVFGPSSTGLGRHPSHSNNTGSSKNKESGGPYGSGKPSTPDYKTPRSAGPVYQNETAEPSYLSSSIYYLLWWPRRLCPKYRNHSSSTYSEHFHLFVTCCYMLTLKVLELTIFLYVFYFISPRKMEVIMIQMGAVLQGETGGKDLSTTK
ncbi:hypothetical protein Hanom_Chr07g00673221 [Helianthus anomalus]